MGVSLLGAVLEWPLHGPPRPPGPSQDTIMHPRVLRACCERPESHCPLRGACVMSRTPWERSHMGSRPNCCSPPA